MTDPDNSRIDLRFERILFSHPAPNEQNVCLARNRGGRESNVTRRMGLLPTTYLPAEVLTLQHGRPAVGAY